ncbi:acetolactate synthase small subunit [Candidatus Bathyarchaeota archaeon]|nr:acetolactate synthase small subunit [Candidatus Bathyarchaeota archaeon]MCK5625792.1 acetolactate synthase small subunit [Candidatus Bathyarchaeota archaeon]
MTNNQTYILSFIVENKPGVLYQISNMFRRRSFNIESLTVGPTENEDFARMTITVKGNENTIEQLTKQTNKLMDVIKVTILDKKNTVMREIALIKIFTADSKTRSEVIQYVDVFRGHIVDVSLDSLIVEMTGDSNKINAFIDLSRPFGIKELARTGITALTRGRRVIKK